MDSATATSPDHCLLSVITACLLSYVVDNGFRRPYYNRMMGADGGDGVRPFCGQFGDELHEDLPRVRSRAGDGIKKLQLAEKLKDRVNDVLDPATATTEVVFEEGEESP